MACQDPPVRLVRDRGWIAALALLTLLRLAVAARAGLAPDETYYALWARIPQAGYLDHPFMVALWAWIGMHIASGALGLRLLSPVAAAGGSLLLAGAGRALGRNGIAAAAMLNATLLLGAGAVTLTPDTPLILFWTGGLYAMARLVETGRGGWWLPAGAAAGLAMDSKYTGALFPLSVAAWLCLAPGARRWLRRPEPYLAAVMAAALFAPTLWWNAAHGWASFTKQGGRSGDWHPERALRFLAELAGGQVGLATPVLFGLMLAGTIRACRRGRRDPGAALVACLVLAPAAVFVQHAIGDRVQANWPCVLYPAASLAAAGRVNGGWRGWPRRWRAGIAIGFAVTALVYLQAAWPPLPLPARLDVTLARLGGWPAWAGAVDAARRARGADFLVADDYGLAAELAWSLPADAPVLAAGARWRLFALPEAHPAGRGLLVRPEGQPPCARLAPLPGEMVRAAGGRVAARYRLFALPPAPDASCPALAPLVALPARNVIEP